MPYFTVMTWHVHSLLSSNLRGRVCSPRVPGEAERSMLLLLRRGTCFRVTAFAAALAVASLVAPHLALAFASPEAAAHCLVHAELGHDEAGDGGHDIDHHGTMHDKSDHKSTCCGMFCSTALASEAGAVTGLIWHDSIASPAAAPDFRSRSPEQPDRPPISRLSF